MQDAQSHDRKSSWRVIGQSVRPAFVPRRKPGAGGQCSALSIQAAASLDTLAFQIGKKYDKAGSAAIFVVQSDTCKPYNPAACQNAA
jgi:hypothetical protein